MALYGSVESVKQLLSATSADDFSDDVDTILGGILGTVSVIIEAETQTVFAPTPAAESIVASAPQPTPTLWLPKALHSITSVTTGQDWSGTAWTGGTLVTASTYRRAGLNPSGAARTILRTGGYAWLGEYVIAGVWEDREDEVPTAITGIANYITAELYKTRQASPAGFVGPDGVVPIRNIFKDPEVVKVLDRYRLGAGFLVL